MTAAFFSTIYPHVIHTPRDLASVAVHTRLYLFLLDEGEVDSLSTMNGIDKATWYANLKSDDIKRRREATEKLFVDTGAPAVVSDDSGEPRMSPAEEDANLQDAIEKEASKDQSVDVDPMSAGASAPMTQEERGDVGENA